MFSLNPNNLAITKYSQFGRFYSSTKTELARLGVRCSDFAVAVLNERFIYVTGGMSANKRRNIATYCYDTASDRWYKGNKFTPGLRQQRSGHSSCTLGEKIYVFAGTDGI